MQVESAPHIIVLLLSGILFLSGCSRQQPSSAYKWPSSGTEFDSITARLEGQFNDYSPFDSISAGIYRLDSLSRHGSDAQIRLRKSRVLYWKSRFLSRVEDHDSALMTVKKALALNDSAMDRYDFLRMRVLMAAEDLSTPGDVKYRTYSDALEYCEAVADPGFEAMVAILMGNLMGEIKEYDQSLVYLDLADSLNNMLGFRKLAVKNGINRAKVIEERGKPGDAEKSDSIMRSLVDDPAFDGDTLSLNILYRNLYISSGDKSLLLRAYRQIDDSPRFRHLRGLYCGMLANHYYYEGNRDSTVHYADLALRDLPYVTDPAHKAHIWLVEGFSWIAKSRPDSALACRLRYEEFYNESLSLRQEADVLRLDALHEIDSREARYAEQIYRRNMVIALISVIMVTSAIVTLLVFSRRHIRNRMSTLEKELDLEKAKRKIAATALTIEEKNNLLGTLKNELSEMRKEGMIKETSVRHLESTIKSHLLDNTNEETFHEMFDVVNPNFNKHLRELCPDLAENYVRLASYILMGLDNKRIATLMMIRPESVRQSRWRLSRKLSVPEGVTLESFLTDINSRN